MVRIAPAPTLRPMQPQRSLLARATDSLWWFFTSVRVALWLIAGTVMWILLATLAQSTFPTWVAEQVPALGDLMKAWSKWEVWLSPLFLITLSMLAVSTILGGIVNRWPGIVQRVWHPNIRTSPGFFKAVKHHAEYDAPDAETATAAFDAALAGKRYRHLSHVENDGTLHLYADKNRYSPLATTPFHIGLVTIMLGAVIMASLGWREFGFLIPDGGSRAVGHGTGLTVTNLGFAADYYDDGRAKDYYSDLVIRDMAGNVVERGRLRVNDPLSVGAVSFHQATFGNAARFVVRDATGKVIFDDGIPLLEPSAQAQALGVTRTIGVQSLDALGLTLRIGGSSGQFDETLRTGQMAVALFDNRAARQSNGPLGTATLDPGGSTTISGLTIAFTREMGFTGLQVTYAPGLPIIYLAAAMIFLSLLVTFYLPQRRVRALVIRKPDGTARLLLGVQLKHDFSGAKEFDKIAAKLREALNAESRQRRGQGGEQARHVAVAGIELGHSARDTMYFGTGGRSE